jgi:hypothetical protein
MDILIEDAAVPRDSNAALQRRILDEMQALAIIKEGLDLHFPQHRKDITARELFSLAANVVKERLSAPTSSPEQAAARRDDAHFWEARRRGAAHSLTIQ